MRGSISLQAVMVFSMAAAILGLSAGPAGAVIIIDADTTINGPGGAIGTANFGAYDASGADKLVILVGGGRDRGSSLGINSVTYNGVALTEAIKASSSLTSPQGVAAGIYYLDAPGAAGDIVVNFSAKSWGIRNSITVLELSGTAPGVGPAAGSPDTPSVSLPTWAFDNLVLGVSKGVSDSDTEVPQAPLVDLSGTRHGAGYQDVSSVLTTVTPTFSDFAPSAGGAMVGAVFEAAVPTLYWDINGTADGAGGATPTGTWDNANTSWNTDYTGGAGGSVGAWTANNVARFAAGDDDASGTYTVTVEGPHDITGLGFEEGTVTLAAGTGGALRVTDDSILYVAPGLAATVETPISDDGSARKLYQTGAGTLTISGDLSHTGLTTLGAGGTLILSGNNVDANGGMTIDGTVHFESSASINGTARDVTVNVGGAVAFGASLGDANIPTALANRIVATSAGAIAADNYDATDFDFDTPGLDTSLGAVGSVSYTGTLTPKAATYRLGGGGGTLTMANANAVTGAGNSLVVSGPGTVVLANSNDYGGATTIASGTLQMGDAAALGTSQSLAFSTGSTGMLQLNGYNQTFTSLTSDGGTPAIENGAGTDVVLTVNNSSDRSYGGTLQNGAGGGKLTLTKEGAGALTLSGSANQSSTTINGGTLRLGASNVIADSAPVTVNASGTLDMNGYGDTISKLEGSGNVTSTATASTLTLKSGGSFTFSGVISGDGLSLTYYSGSQTLTLDNQNTYGGSTRIGMGGTYNDTLKLGVDDALPSGNPVKADGSGACALDLNGYDQTVGLLSLGSNNGGQRGQVKDSVGGGVLTITDGVLVDGHNDGAGGIFCDTVDLNGTTQTFTINNNRANTTLLVSSVIRNGGLTIKGGGPISVITLSGELLYAGGTTVESGILSYTNVNDGLDDASTVDIFAGAKMDLNFLGEDTIAALILDGLDVGIGSYDTTHATYGSYFTGTGALLVYAGVAGDADGDGDVDAADYIVLKTNMGQASGAVLADGDFDEDGDVDWDDLQILQDNYGKTSAGASGTIPEPATLGLLAIGAVAVLRRRR